MSVNKRCFVESIVDDLREKFAGLLFYWSLRPGGPHTLGQWQWKPGIGCCCTGQGYLGIRVTVEMCFTHLSFSFLLLSRRQAGEVNYADVDHKGGGIVHFANRDDMEYALRKLDGSEFSNRYDSATIQVSFFVAVLAAAARNTQYIE